jgi:hypothetical protein
METKAGHRHVLGLARTLEPGKDALELVNVVSTQFAPVIILEEPFQGLVSKTSDHVTIVYRLYTLVNDQRNPRCHALLTNSACAARISSAIAAEIFSASMMVGMLVLPRGHWHDRGIHHPQADDAANASAGIDHRIAVAG